MSINNEQIWQSTEKFWEEQIIESLSEYIRIPNKSPMFDPNWKSNGYMDDVVRAGVIATGFWGVVGYEIARPPPRRDVIIGQ